MRIVLAVFIGVITILPVSIQTARSAPASHIVISEIKITGETGFSTDEFVELYNPTSSSVQLKSFKLTKKTAAGSEYDLLSSFSDRTVVPGGYFLITHPTGYRGAVPADVVFDTTNSIASNNSVFLYDFSGNVIDTVGLGTAAIVETTSVANPAANKSVERKADSSSTIADMIEGGAHYFRGNSEDTDNNTNDFITRDAADPQNSASEPEFVTTALTVPVLPPASPTSINSPSTPAQSSSPAPSSSSNSPQNLPSTQVQQPPDITDGIILNEVYPAPKESTFTEEYIELMNTTSRTVRLDGWRLTDTKKKFIIPTGVSVGAGDTLKFLFGQTKITLNNGGDTIFLQDPTGKVVQGVQYNKAPYDKAFAFFVGAGWKWTEPTPGDENVPDEEITAVGETQKSPTPVQQVDDFKSVTIVETRTLARGTKVRVEATVIAEPGILGTGVLYVRDGSGGNKIVVSGSPPDISEGDVIRFDGTIGQEAGNPKINVKDAETISVLRSENVVPPSIAFTDIGSNLYQLVRIGGTVQSIERSTVTIENEDGDTVVVYFKKTTGITKPDWKEGDAVTVVGVVDEVNGEIRILPRREEDITKLDILSETTASSSEEQGTEQVIEIPEDEKNTNSVLFIVGGFVVAGGAAGWAIYDRRKKAMKLHV